MSKHKLSQDEIGSLPEGLHATGWRKGLCVRVYSSGVRNFFFRYKFAGQTILKKIGVYPYITAAELESIVDRCRSLLTRNIDPFTQGFLSPPTQSKSTKHDSIKAKAQAEPTPSVHEPHDNIYLSEAMHMFFDYLEATGSFKHNRNAYSMYLGLLNNHILPLFGNVPLKKLNMAALCDYLVEQQKTHPYLAERLKTFIKKFIEWSKAKGLYRSDIDFNLQLKVFVNAFNNSELGVTHNPSLDFTRIPQFFSYLHDLNSNSARCFMFSILTCSRSKAVRLLTWEQIDWDNHKWHIPLANDKSKVKGRNRTIILSPEAEHILLMQKQLNAASCPFVFCNKNGDPFSSAVFTSVLKLANKLCIERGEAEFYDQDNLDAQGQPRLITQHGTARASFKTWTRSDVLGNHKTFHEEAVEMCLLHERKDPFRGAYDRSKFLQERTKIMNEWAKYCYSLITEKLKPN